MWFSFTVPLFPSPNGSIANASILSLAYRCAQDRPTSRPLRSTASLRWQRFRVSTLTISSCTLLCRHRTAPLALLFPPLPFSLYSAQKKEEPFGSPSPFTYSITPVTTPAPTVRPPSRIANRSPSSIAIGVISLIVIWMLSPGITISTPSGKSMTPVTSVVRK